jgi:hypothetical protein
MGYRFEQLPDSNSDKLNKKSKYKKMIRLIFLNEYFK